MLGEPREVNLEVANEAKREKTIQFWSSLTKEEKEILLSGALSFWTPEDYDDILCAELSGKQMEDANNKVFLRLVKNIDKVAAEFEKFRTSDKNDNEKICIQEQVARAQEDYEKRRKQLGKRL